MEKKWIRTEDMVADIKANSDMTLEYEHWLGGPLIRTHCFFFDSKTGILYDDGGEADYQETTFAALLSDFPRHPLAPFSIISISPFIFHPSSFIFHLSSFIFHLPPFTLHPSSFIFHPSSFILHLSSFIFHPSSFTLHPSSFIFHPSSFTIYS